MQAEEKIKAAQQKAKDILMCAEQEAAHTSLKPPRTKQFRRAKRAGGCRKGG